MLLLLLFLSLVTAADHLEVYSGRGEIKETMSVKESAHYLEEMFTKEQGISLLLLDLKPTAAEHKLERFKVLVRHFHDGVTALRLVVGGTKIKNKEVESWWVKQTNTYDKIGGTYSVKWLGGSVLCLVRAGELVGGVFWEAPSDTACVTEFLSARLGMGTKMDPSCQLIDIHDPAFHPLITQRITRVEGHEDL